MERMNAFDNLSNYIEKLEQGGRQARTRVVELADEVNELREENRNLKEELEKWKNGNSLAFDDIERICNEKLALENENKKLKSNLKWYQKHYGPKPLTTIEEVQDFKGNTIWM